MHIITRGLQPKEALEVLTKAIKRENATKLDLFGGEKNEFPLLPTSLENLLLGKDPGAVRGERCSLFLALRCFGDVLTKTLLYDGLDDVLKKPKHPAFDAY